MPSNATGLTGLAEVPGPFQDITTVPDLPGRTGAQPPGAAHIAEVHPALPGLPEALTEQGHPDLLHITGVDRQQAEAQDTAVLPDQVIPEVQDTGAAPEAVREVQVTGALAVVTEVQEALGAQEDPSDHQAEDVPAAEDVPVAEEEDNNSSSDILKKSRNEKDHNFHDRLVLCRSQRTGHHRCAEIQPGRAFRNSPISIP